MDIRVTDPGLDGVRAVLSEYHAFMRASYPEEACFLLDINALRDPETTFLAAWEGEICEGVGAVRIKDGYAELKSMYTRPEARGQGVAAAIVTRLEDIARSHRRHHVMIETGPKFTAAMALYERFGYALRGAFGEYEENPYSIFYEKHLPSVN